jgi:hypothetical protein
MIPAKGRQGATSASVEVQTFVAAPVNQTVLMVASAMTKNNVIRSK